eukprot:TRINITY_DN3838_c0_g1_i2.p1 TRINITY_DN3838_c0_g1~~TRINITY_DN3838_c0_g1_i2.p1  ORF type:complete len:267 (-),score=47.86 TRINITY_DN3838_c0_g1_i2:40-840(-)
MPKGDEFFADLDERLVDEQSRARNMHGIDFSRINFSWREPRPLLQTEDSKRVYQTDPGFGPILRKEIQSHYVEWRKGARDKQLHPLFLCMSAPGTGKSRLLHEFPRLVKESLSGVDGVEQFVNCSFCFNVSFENGTSENPEPFHPSNVVGTRMMYQLQNDLKWSTFRHVCSFSIPKAVGELARLTDQEPSDMCVILCIDGMQKLDHQPGSKNSHLYKTMSAICSVINDSDAFVIAICSSTVDHAVYEVLSSSAQRRVSLIPPAVNL